MEIVRGHGSSGRKAINVSLSTLSTCPPLVFFVVGGVLLNGRRASRVFESEEYCACIWVSDGVLMKNCGGMLSRVRDVPD
jgi:hypothetical protein